MKFSYELDGQPVVIDVFHYKRECPMRITGTGFGDADPPEPEELEFDVLDANCLPCPTLAEKIDDAEELRILAYYKKLRGLA